MNIGFDAKRYFYNLSGLGNYSRNIVSYLTENYPNNDYFLFKPNISNTLNFTLDNKLKIIEPEINNFSFKNSLWRTKGVLKEADFKKLDVFHGLSNELPIGIYKTSVKSVLSVHDLIFIRFAELYKFIDRKIYTWKIKKSCHEADKIIAISEQTKTDIVDFLNVKPEKIEVVYQGCNSFFFSKVEEFEKKKVQKKYSLPKDYILNVGTIEPRKNALLLVKAVFHSKIKIPLVIVGKNTTYTKEIQLYIAEKQMQKRVIILNDVSFQDLPAIYQGAKIFVYPSYFEGFGIPIVEAFNSKIPVIASDISIFKEVAADAAVFFENNNVESLSEKLIFLLNNKQEQLKFVNLGIKRAEFFMGDKISKDLMNIYKSIV
ncbi:MAG: glycosyltransferase family 4 protein [Bacteroidales bacterium]|nr:glycosyltransferase family 4 protein [Bacteroidales bacterium]